MSVSAFNQSVAHAPDKASHSDTKLATSQQSAGLSFKHLDHFGPVFDSAPQRPIPGYGHFHPALPQRPLPVYVRPNPGPPPRPTPTLPDPHYSKQSNEQLAQTLLNNYDAFRGRWPSRQVSPQSLQRMADRPLTGHPHMDANIRLARELLRRPELMQALDRNGSTGALDGRLSKDDIRSLIRSDNPLKLKDDKQLVQEMLNHFNELKGGFWKSKISLSDLNRIASRPLTGNPSTYHLIQLSREVMARSNLKGMMDNVHEWRRDGKISRYELLKLL